jgi:hypothetical protein
MPTRNKKLHGQLTRRNAWYVVRQTNAAIFVFGQAPIHIRLLALLVCREFLYSNGKSQVWRTRLSAGRQRRRAKGA